MSSNRVAPETGGLDAAQPANEGDDSSSLHSSEGVQGTPNVDSGTLSERQISLSAGPHFKIEASNTLEEIVTALKDQDPQWLDDLRGVPVVMLFGGLLEGIDCPLFQIKNRKNGDILAERENKDLAKEKKNKLEEKLGAELQVIHVFEPEEQPMVVKYWEEKGVLNPMKTSGQNVESMSNASSPDHVVADMNGQDSAEPETEELEPPGTEIPPKKRELLTRVKSSIEALARVFHECKAVLVTDYPYHMCKDENVPVRILLEAMSRLQGNNTRVILVHDYHRKNVEEEELRKANFMVRIEVSNQDDGKAWIRHPIGVAQARMGMAIAEVTGQRVLSVLVSGGNMCLKQMGAVVKPWRRPDHDGPRIPRMPSWRQGLWGWGEEEEEDGLEDSESESFCIVLQGSGRLSDVWHSLWPNRATTEFDSVKVSAKLEEEIGYPPDSQGVSCLEEILAHGQLALHDLTSSSSTLKRLCRLHLETDDTMDIALEWLREYKQEARKQRWPRILVQGSMLLAGLLATIFSVLDWLPNTAWVTVALPAVLAILGQIDGSLRLTEREGALIRAAGTVDSLIFRYRARALEFSDAALAKKRAAMNGITDLMTCRQQALAAALTTVNRQVMATGALVASLPESNNNVGTMASLIGPAGSARVSQRRRMGSPITGDRYLEVRVNRALKRSKRMAILYGNLALLFRVIVWSGSIAGTLLAIPNFGLIEYVAIAVAVSSAAQQVLRGWRLAETREAHRVAAAVLRKAHLHWRSLPEEVHTKQAEIDRLVGQCERVLYATLPPRPSGNLDLDDDADASDSAADTSASERES